MLHSLESSFGRRDNASTAKAFLQATAKGYEYAASHPEEAAEILCSEVAKDTSSQPLPTPLDPDMVLQSQQLLSEVCAICFHSDVEPVSAVRSCAGSVADLTVRRRAATGPAAHHATWSLAPAEAVEWQAQLLQPLSALEQRWHRHGTVSVLLV